MNIQTSSSLRQRHPAAAPSPAVIIHPVCPASLSPSVSLCFGQSGRLKRGTIRNTLLGTLFTMMIGTGLAQKTPVIQPLIEPHTSVIQKAEHVNLALTAVCILDILLLSARKGQRQQLVHELGHAVAFDQQVRQQDFAVSTRTDKALSIATSNLTSLFKDGVFDMAYSAKYFKEFDRMYSLRNEVLQRGHLYTPAYTQFRKNYARYLREFIVVCYAGPRLEERIFKDSVPLSDLFDKKAALHAAHILATLQKPLSKWSPSEYFAFVRSELKQGKQEATTVVNALDEKRLLDVVDEMATQSRLEGKTAWSAPELEQVLQKITGEAEN